MGLSPLLKFDAIDRTGRAYLAGIEVGDTILRWDDHAHPTYGTIARAIGAKSKEDIPFTVRKPGGRLFSGFVRPKTIRYGAGVGIQYLTPIGFVTFAVAGKLNPSYFDVRSPRDILVAADIEAISAAPPDFDVIADDWVRRLQFHFTIGQRF